MALVHASHFPSLSRKLSSFSLNPPKFKSGLRGWELRLLPPLPFSFYLLFFSLSIASFVVFVCTFFKTTTGSRLFDGLLQPRRSKMEVDDATRRVTSTRERSRRRLEAFRHKWELLNKFGMGPLMDMWLPTL